LAGQQGLSAPQPTKRNPEVDYRHTREKTSSARDIKTVKLKYTSARRFLMILAFICAISIGTAAAQSGGRLIVLRAPNFGWNLSLHLQIDGRTVANVVQGRRYDHFVPAGRHVLTVSAVPNVYSYQPTPTVLNVQPGRTYVFHCSMAEFGSGCLGSISTASRSVLLTY
jgi:hypothetical protein